MTEAEEVYFSTLNLLGSDVEPPEIQALIDHEHALADPTFATYLERVALLEQVKQQRFVTTGNQECGVFESDGERSLYLTAATTWNNLQALIKVTDALLREHMAEHDKLSGLLKQREGAKLT